MNCIGKPGPRIDLRMAGTPGNLDRWGGRRQATKRRNPAVGVQEHIYIPELCENQGGFLVVGGRF